MYITMSPRIATHSRDTPTITKARMTLVFLILSSAGIKLDVYMTVIGC